MSTNIATVASPHPLAAERRVDRLSVVGTAVLRYGLVLLLLMWGPIKFAAFEANAIQPLLENSPLTSWLLSIVGLRGTSALIGVFEITVAVLIASRHWFPRVSGYASLAAVGMFVVTLSFLLTTPGVFQPSSPWGGFLMKDIMLLGGALFTAGEALRAGRSRAL